MEKNQALTSAPLPHPIPLLSTEASEVVELFTLVGQPVILESKVEFHDAVSELTNRVTQIANLQTYLLTNPRLPGEQPPP